MATQNGNAHVNNTKESTCAKNRMFLLTINEKSIEHYNEIRDYIQDLKSVNYYLTVEHHGQENKHYHMAIQCKNPIKLSTKKLYGAHIDTLKYGNFNDIIRYCKCEDKKHKELGITHTVIEEWGEVKHGHRFPTIKEVKAMCKEEREDIGLQYQKIVKSIDIEEDEKTEFINMLEEIENDILRSPDIIYIMGGSGEGKTYYGYKWALNKYKKNEIGKITINNNFIKIINEDAKCFVIEEFRPSQIKGSEFLQLTDKYGYSCNIKGGHVYIRPQCLIICSIINPLNIYKEEINKQFIRRITKFIYMKNKQPIEITVDDLNDNIGVDIEEFEED